MLCSVLVLQVMREKAAIQDVLEAPLAAPRGARSADAMQDAREDKDQRSSNATSSSPTPPSALLPEGVPLSTFLPSADPTVLAAQLKQVQELQAEVERLRAFTSQHLVNSEKVCMHRKRRCLAFNHDPSKPISACTLLAALCMHAHSTASSMHVHHTHSMVGTSFLCDRSWRVWLPFHACRSRRWRQRTTHSRQSRTHCRVN